MGVLFTPIVKDAPTLLNTTNFNLRNASCNRYTLNIFTIMKHLLLATLLILGFASAKAQLIINNTITTNVTCNGGADGAITTLASGGIAPYTYSLNGSPGIVPNVFTNLTAGVYTIVVTDASTATISTTALIVQPPLLVATINASTVLCNGGVSNITTTVTGGVPSYTYNWTPATGLSSTTISNPVALAGYTYTCVVSDAHACTTSVTTTITQPSLLVAMLASQNNIPCNGGNNGSATITVTGGVTPYTYLWSGGQTTATANGLTVGTYTCIVTDANLCTISKTVTITQPTMLNAIISANMNVLCNGGSTGSATVLASGGVASYTYNWSNGQTTATANNLIAGTYTCIVTDANGCNNSTTVTITQPTFLNATIVAQTHVSCYLGNNGSATVMTFGGTSPYTYLWSNSQVTATALGLTTGTYTCTVTDPNNCTKSTTVTITQPTAISPTSTLISSNTSQAVYNITATGGTGVITGIGSYTVTSAGTYTNIVTDANGCTQSVTTIISLNANPIIAIINKTNVACNGGATGSIALSASNCTGPYTYLWQPGAFTTSSISSLVAGAYTCTVTDNLGMSATTVVTITQSATPVTISVTKQVGCKGAISTIGVKGIGGTGFYNCVWSNGTIYNGSGFSTITVTNTSVYTCTVTDGNSCSLSTTLALPYNPSNMASSFIINNNACTTGSNSAVVTTTGGNIPYTYVWGNTNGGTNIPNGTFVLQTTDASACIKFDTLKFNTNSFTINNTQSDTICLGQSRLLHINYQFNGSNNVGLAASNFKWYPATGLNTNTGLNVYASPTTTTTYTIVSSNPNMCDDTLYKTITVFTALPGIVVNGIVTNATCLLSTDGQISVSTTPVTAGLIYNWSNGNTTATNNGLLPGNYTVQVSNGSACVYQTFIVNNTNTNCGNINGRIVLDANSNCIADVAEYGIANTMVTLAPSGLFTFADALGNYSFVGLPYNNYTITKANNISGYTNVCGATGIANLNASTPNVSVHFTDSSLTALDYILYSWGGCMAPALPGNSRYIAYRHTKYGTTSTGIIYAVFDSIIHYGSSVPTHSSINGDTVFWSVSNITTAYNNYINIQFAYPNAVALGTLMPFKYGYLSTQYTDIDLSNNFGAFNFNTCTGFDPNDKNVMPQGKTNNGYITASDSVLTYTVRFQNTGNATAANVIIIDSISNALNLQRFKVLGSSHNYAIELVNNSVIKFKFMGIMLPDSNNNEPASHGYITYQIAQKTNNVPATTIQNTAYIYFDYNAPVVTNTTLNTIYKPLLLQSAVTFRNTNCNTPCGNGYAQFTTAYGVPPMVYTINPSCSATVINGNTIDKLLGGTYTVQTKDATGETNSTIINIANPVAISTTIATTTVTGGNNGTATATVTGGTMPYTYLWQPGNATSNVLSNATVGKYYVIVTDAQGCTDSVNVTIAFPTNINAANKNNWIKMYPNPASNTLTVQSAVGIQAITILNATGQVVQTIAAKNAIATEIDISNLNNGIYFIKIDGYGLQKISVFK
jgi:Secretion system C-terminal sorting domain/SprB repeat